MERIISQRDRNILRGLAGRVREIAAEPEVDQRRRSWFEHNSLQSKRPMMLVFPEGSWTELLPEASLACQGEFARSIESNLRMRIYTFEHFQDDSVIEAEWVEGPVMSDTGWGVEVRRHPSPDERGAWAFEPVIRQPGDLKVLHFPDLVYDADESRRNTEQMHDLFGDLVEVKAAGIKHFSYHLMKQLTDWCGLGESLAYMAERPDFVHEVMSFLEEGHHRFLVQLVQANLFSLNNDNAYHSSGGNGYTQELPAPGFDPKHVRPCDMWASAESQEMALVSPRMHAEFALAYEKRLLEPFGLNGYGCCEDLSRKLDYVFTIPHLRRISISPFADVDRSAVKLKGNFIFSWKPHPSHLVGGFDEPAIRAYIRHTLEVCRENGCILEMILKDTHTCEFHPERFDRWTEIAREEINRVTSEE
jgi:hypothetical protein